MEFAEYPEHDHAGDGQEEIYASRRRLLAGPYGARVLAIGRAPDGAYERPDTFRPAARA